VTQRYVGKSPPNLGLTSFRTTDDHYIYRIAAGPSSLFVVEGSFFNPSTMMRIDEVAFP